MSSWKKYKLLDLLSQYRELVHIADDVHYGQITISKDNSIKYRCQTIGKEIGRKRQFKIDLKKYPHTLLFTRQGVLDGSIGIAPTEVDGCIATENMPMFSVNTKIINVDLLMYLIKSDKFKKSVKKLTPTGSAQKAIHERDLLNIEVIFPEDIEQQKQLVNKVKSSFHSIYLINNNIKLDFESLIKLRQSILQDAIEGKLTAEWRKQNPVIKGDPNTDVHALLNEILIYWKSNNTRNRALKNGQSISSCDISSWVLTNIDSISTVRVGGTPSRSISNYWANDIQWVSSGEVANCEIFQTKESISVLGSNNSAAKTLPEGSVLVAMIGQGKTRGQAAILRTQAATNQNVCGLLVDHGLIDSQFLFYYFLSKYEESRSFATGGNQPALSGEKIGNFTILLPPLKEQKLIANNVSSLLDKIYILEQQVIQRKIYTEQLMQAVLKEAFTPT